MSDRPGPESDPDSDELIELVLAAYPQARVTAAVARQLAPCLPIRSFAELEEQVPAIVVDGHELRLAMFRRHVRAELFPVESLKDLVDKLSIGVRNAIALARSGAFKVSSPAASALLASSLKTERPRRAAVPMAFHAGSAASPRASVAGSPATQRSESEPDDGGV